MTQRPGGAKSNTFYRSNIANAIIVMVHSLGFVVIAEGVEKESQLESLRRYDCNEAQGYLFSHLLTAENLQKLLIYS